MNFLTSKHSLLLLAASAVVPYSSSFAKTKSEKPNFLFICIDDLRTQIGAYEHDFMITPNLDALASEGRLFYNHYVQVPTSGSSRACMLTGKAVANDQATGHEHLARTLVGAPEGELPETFIHHLKRNGYYTVGMGKISHNGDGHYNAQGNRTRELPHSWDNFINDPNNIWGNRGNDLLHGYADGLIREKYENNPAFEFKEREDESYPDGRLVNLATAELERLSQQDEPFFMAVGFYKPHLPFCAPQKYWDMYEDVDIALSPNPDAPEGVDKVFLHASSEFFGQYHHPEKGGLGVRLSDNYAKNVRRAYYAALTYTDTQLGKLMSKFKELGLDENTIIVVWGDHGWHLGDQTIWGKHSPFERALGSTLIVKTPEMKQKGKPTRELVATIDLYPTFCELAGVQAPEGIEGESIVPILKNPKAQIRTEVMSYWHNMLSMRTDRYRFAMYSKDGNRQVMLFDHQNDPYETVNVAQDNPAVVEQLTSKMRELNRGYLPDL